MFPGKVMQNVPDSFQRNTKTTGESRLTELARVATVRRFQLLNLSVSEFGTNALLTPGNIAT